MGVVRVTNGVVGGFTFGVEDGTAVGDTAPVGPELESLEGDAPEPGAEPGVGLAGGNTSCETAITTSERNRARKKRLSIQGTGS
jgi:hypothetical protein